MIWAFFFIMYLMILFQIIVDIFRDSAMNGWVKAIWLIALLFIPLLTALIYVIARGKGMTERSMAAAQQSRAEAEDYIRSVSGSTDPAAQIANAKALLDAGTISQAEFDQIKAKALA
jgi:hypothetical protein